MDFLFTSKTGDEFYSLEDILALITFAKDKDGRSFYSRYEEGSELTEVLLYDFIKSVLGLVPAYLEEFYVLVNGVICALDKGDPYIWRPYLEVEDNSIPDWTDLLLSQAEDRNYRKGKKPPEIIYLGSDNQPAPRSRICHATAFYLRFYSQDPLPTLEK